MGPGQEKRLARAYMKCRCVFLCVFFEPIQHWKNKENPLSLAGQRVFGAAGRIRTADLILTKDALYLLSYSSIHAAHAALYSKRLSPICCNGDPERARTVDLQRDRLAF